MALTKPYHEQTIVRGVIGLVAIWMTWLLRLYIVHGVGEQLVVMMFVSLSDWCSDLFTSSSWVIGMGGAL